jgi:broad specificity phosphatase PhoE
MTVIILARHGNTFETGQKSAWVGARTDIPLTTFGQKQASDIGRALRNTGLMPQKTLTGPLRRTMETAEIVLFEAGIPLNQLEVDDQLREIDYGNWEGMTTEQICIAYGKEELDQWENSGIWPKKSGWPLAREYYISALSNIIDKINKCSLSPTLIVSSNGLFRILSSVINHNQSSSKMSTGHLSVLNLENNGTIKILGWNLAPSDLRNIVVE